MSFKFVLFIFCWPLLFRLLDLGSLLFLFILFSSRAFGLILSFPLASLVLSSSFFFTRLPNSVVVVVAMILGGETECVPQHVENSLLLWFSFMSFRVPTDFVLLRPLAVYSLILYSTWFTYVSFGWPYFSHFVFAWFLNCIFVRRIFFPVGRFVVSFSTIYWLSTFRALVDRWDRPPSHRRKKWNKSKKEQQKTKHSTELKRMIIFCFASFDSCSLDFGGFVTRGCNLVVDTHPSSQPVSVSVFSLRLLSSHFFLLSSVPTTSSFLSASIQSRSIPLDPLPVTNVSAHDVLLSLLYTLFSLFSFPPRSVYGH